MRSFKWALIQYDWCPNKKGKIVDTLTDTQREEDVKAHREKTASHVTGVMTSISQGMPRITGKHQKLEEARKHSSLKHQRKHSPANPLISDI